MAIQDLQDAGIKFPVVQAAEQANVPPTMVRKWLKNKAAILAANMDKRKLHTGPRPKRMAVEEALVEYVSVVRQQRLPVTVNILSAHVFAEFKRNFNLNIVSTVTDAPQLVGCNPHIRPLPPCSNPTISIDLKRSG